MLQSGVSSLCWMAFHPCGRLGNKLRIVSSTVHAVRVLEEFEVLRSRGQAHKGEFCRQDAEKRRCSLWLKDCTNTFVKLGSAQTMHCLTCTGRHAWLNGAVNLSTAASSDQLAWTQHVHLDTKPSKALLSSAPVSAVVDCERARFT